jgi:hypothetical protein
MKILEDINKIVDHLKLLDFELERLSYDNVVEILRLNNKTHTFKLELTNFSRSYVLTITLRNGEWYPPATKLTKFDADEILNIINKTFKKELRDIKLNKLLN